MTDPAAPAAEPRRRGRWYLWVGAILLVVASVAASGASAVSLQLAADQPRALVTRYLSALQHGRAEEAMRLGRIAHTAGDILLSDRAYARATARVSSFRVDRPVTRGRTTTVEATIVQGDRELHRSFAVERAGGLPGVPLWRLAKITPDTVAFSVQAPAGVTYTIAGRRPPSQTLGTAVSLRALPGTYAVAFTAPSEDYRVWDADVTSAPAGGEQPARFVAQLSSTGDAKGRQSVDAWLDACAASPSTAPPGCPFVVDDHTSDGLTVGDVHWILGARPSVSIDPGWVDGGWTVSGTDGRVSAAATLTRPSDGATGEGTTDVFAFAFTGVLVAGADGLAFTPLTEDGTVQG